MLRCAVAWEPVCVEIVCAKRLGFALVKLLTANTVNAATLIVLQTQTRTSYVAVLSMVSVCVGIVAVQETGQAPRVAAQRVQKAV